VQLDYDEKHVDKCLHYIIEQKLFWEDLFKASGSIVHRVLYEDFMLQPDIAINAVADFVGVALDEGCRMDIPLIESQRDETSREWRERYLASRSVRGLGSRYEELLES
jgi:LPS sulfotransferase NodH